MTAVTAAAIAAATGGILIRILVSGMAVPEFYTAIMTIGEPGTVITHGGTTRMDTLRITVIIMDGIVRAIPMAGTMDTGTTAFGITTVSIPETEVQM